MAISMKKYVDIKSSTNTTRTATEKELIARIFTASASLTEAVAECEDLNDVATIFGTSSDEYALASKYFSFVNKYARSPRKISFAQDTRGDNVTIVDTFNASYQASNNFATFMFVAGVTAAEAASLGTAIATNYPSEFMFVIPVTSSTYSTTQAAVAAIDGISLELCGATEVLGKFNYILPMAITATSDYNKVNGTVDYMYTQDANMKIMVNNDTDMATYDAVKVNYYGQTQKSGQKLAFYQNGVLQGKYQDQNIFVNEIWLKDAMTTKYINYMLQASNWYANKAGQAIGQGLAMDVIDRAKLNGTITTEKEITDNDKNYIYSITADENAWRQIYQEGFYLTTSISKTTINSQTVYKFNYILLYSKGDSIKKVEGKDILI